MSIQSSNYLLFNLLLALSLSSPVQFSGVASHSVSPYLVNPSVSGIAPGLTTTPTPDPTPVKTEIVTLPLVEKSISERSMQAVLAAQAIQETPDPDAPTPTITPTPLPPQTGLTNLPIVIGAVAIVVVIFFAWLLVGLRPKRRTP